MTGHQIVHHIFYYFNEFKIIHETHRVYVDSAISQVRLKHFVEKIKSREDVDLIGNSFISSNQASLGQVRLPLP